MHISLSSVILPTFNKENSISMSELFYNCISLKYTNMPIFTGCTSLVGGNGTTFDSSKTDKTMAVIDTPSTPGYLTLKQS